jgi:hypothetical protein
MEVNVNTRNLVLGTAMLLPLLAVKPAEAQRVRADIRIGGGPIGGRVILGDRDGYRGRPRLLRGISWIRADLYRRNDWWNDFERGSRIVVVYYDPDDDVYYLDRFAPDLIELSLYERDGRYYRLDDDAYGYGYGIAPRYDIRLNGRFNNWYNQRFGRRDRFNYRVPERPRGDRFDGRQEGRFERRDPRDNNRGGGWDNRGDRDRANQQDNRGDRDRANRQDNRGDHDRGNARDGRDNRGDHDRGNGRDNRRDNGRGNHRGRPGTE